MTRQKKQPDEIVFKIIDNGSEFAMIPPPRGDIYTYPGRIPHILAPSLIPKEGYRFTGYRYEPFMDLCALPVYDMSGTILLPISAVYRKVE